MQDEGVTQFSVDQLVAHEIRKQNDTEFRAFVVWISDVCIIYTFRGSERPALLSGLSIWDGNH